MTTNKSIQIQQDSTNVVGLKPEFIRMPQAVRYSGISRSLIYEYIKSGEIVSKLLRKPGHIRGIRLISVTSLDAFLNNLPEGVQK